jgi:hypothetical protein
VILKRKTRRQLRREYDDVAHGFALGVPVLVSGIIVIALLIWFILWLTTASSKTRGDADVTRQHNSGQNQLAQNAKLLTDNATVTTDLQQIQVLAANVVTEQDRLDLQGLRQNCVNDVNTYDADVKSTLAQSYLPSSLPTSYSATLCQVS